MSIDALKNRFEQITRNPPVSEEILSLIQSINKSGLPGLKKSISNFTSKDLTKKQQQELMKTVRTQNRKLTIRRGKPGIRKNVFNIIRESVNPSTARRNVLRSRVYRNASRKRASRR